MVTLYEGIVTGDLRVPNSLLGDNTTVDSTTGSTTLDPLVGTVQVFLEEPQITVNATIGNLYGLQLVPQKSSKVLVYRTYNDQARIIHVLEDLQPHPIWSFNDSNTTYFQAGEVGIQAIGDVNSSVPQDGGSVWCQNSGDVTIYSGSLTQSIAVSDTLQEVNIAGTTVSMATNTSAVATQALTITTDATGLSSSQWGIQNPTTGVFLNSISISSLGTINLGISDPILGTLISGLSYTSVPSISQPLAGLTLIGPGSISLTALEIDLTGLLSIKGNTTILGALTVTGVTSITGNLGVVGALSISGPVTFGGALSLSGSLNVLGSATIEGGLSVTGATELVGDTEVLGGLDVTGIYSVAGIPGLTGTFSLGTGTITVLGGLVIAVT